MIVGQKLHIIEVSYSESELHKKDLQMLTDTDSDTYFGSDYTGNGMIGFRLRKGRSEL